MDVFGVVYLIRNLVNGKRYVGQTKKTVKERFAEHARCKTSLIGKAIHKYGKKKFRYGIIKTCATREELNYWEIHFIAALKSKVPYGYNLTDGGEGIIGCPEEVQASRSAKLKGVLKSPSHCANIAVGRSGFYGKKIRNTVKLARLKCVLKVQERNATIVRTKIC